MDIITRARIAMLDMQLSMVANKTLRQARRRAIKNIQNATQKQESQRQQTILVKECMGLEEK